VNVTEAETVHEALRRFQCLSQVESLCYHLTLLTQHGAVDRVLTRVSTPILSERTLIFNSCVPVNVSDNEGRLHDAAM